MQLKALQLLILIFHLYMHDTVAKDFWQYQLVYVPASNEA